MAGMNHHIGFEPSKKALEPKHERLGIEPELEPTNGLICLLLDKPHPRTWLILRCGWFNNASFWLHPCFLMSDVFSVTFGPSSMTPYKPCAIWCVIRCRLESVTGLDHFPRPGWNSYIEPLCERVLNMYLGPNAPFKVCPSDTPMGFFKVGFLLSIIFLHLLYRAPPLPAGVGECITSETNLHGQNFVPTTKNKTVHTCS